MIFRSDSRLEKIGKHCFSESRIERIAIPKAVRTISASAFERCESLEDIQVENDCEVSISCTGIPVSARVILSLKNVVSDRPLLDVRKLREIVV